MHWNVTPSLMGVTTPKFFSGLQSPCSKTPKKTMTPRIGSDSENRSCIISFIENISSREVGAAVFRVSPPILTLYQFTDTALYAHSRHLIEIYTPTKVLIPGNVTAGKSPLSQMLKDNSTNSDNKWSDISNNEKDFNNSYTVCEIARSKFSDTIGVSLLSELSNNNIVENTDDQLLNRYLCISALAACIHFVQTDYKIDIIPHTLKIHFQPLEGQLMIDPITLRQFSILSSPLSSSYSLFSTCSSSVASSKTAKSRTQNNQSMFKLHTSKKNFCAPTLFNLLDRCFTNSGARLLRTNLAAPPTKINAIQERQEFVAEVLSKNSNFYDDLIDVFSCIADLDPVITFFVTKGTARIVGFSSIIDSLQRLLCDLDKVNIIHDIFAQMKNVLAQQMAETIENSEFQKINEIISDFLEKDPEIHGATDSSPVSNDSSRQIYAVKSGVLGILDITRKSYEDSLSEIFSLAKDLSDKYSMKINVKFNKGRRFYLQINKSHLEKKITENSVLNSVLDTIDQMGLSPSGYLIPPEMIHVVENSNYVIGTTFDLLLLNKKNQAAQEDSISLTQKFIEGKVEEIRPFIKDIYKISEIIGHIDYLLSLAIVAYESKNYSLPEITRNQMFVLRKARHPIMEKLVSSDFAKKVSTLLPTSTMDTNSISLTPQSTDSSATRASNEKSSSNNSNIGNDGVKFVPNDLDLTTAKNMILLKGINMSGKTTYLQMAVQISIMAQCGSFVPCEKCIINPFTSIFTRSGTNDSIEGNASAFLVEMKEMNHIISLADSTSFIAIDEPCISTSVRDGIGLSFACLEKLISAHSFVICSTHFNELETLADIYPCVSLKEMRSRDSKKQKSLPLNGNDFDTKIEFLYTISDGISQKSLNTCGYGITIAEKYYPDDLIKEARECYENLKEQEVSKKNPKNTGKMASFAILQQLLALKVSSLNDDELRSSIQSIQRRCHGTNKSTKNSNK